jgi:hypothetical protein
MLSADPFHVTLWRGSRTLSLVHPFVRVPAPTAQWHTNLEFTRELIRSGKGDDSGFGGERSSVRRVLKADRGATLQKRIPNKHRKTFRAILGGEKRTLRPDPRRSERRVASRLPTPVASALSPSAYCSKSRSFKRSPRSSRA